MAIDFNKVNEMIRYYSAAKTGLPLDYLTRKWVGPYNPRLHLFNKDGSPIWFKDDELWTKLGQCYCDWYSIPEADRYKFWIEIASLMPTKRGD